MRLEFTKYHMTFYIVSEEGVQFNFIFGLKPIMQKNVLRHLMGATMTSLQNLLDEL